MAGEGLLSTVGTGVAGLVHTFAAALWVSAILAALAVAFAVVKWSGAAYLVYLGVKTLLGGAGFSPAAAAGAPSEGALRQGVIAEILDPEMALFFLAFIPQFMQPGARVFWQFVLLATITTLLTSGVNLLVVMGASPLRVLMRRNRGVRIAQRYGTRTALVGLGVYVAVER